MCWNKDISLNTFLFSSFVLGLIMYNNAYTQYKIVELNNVYAYIFCVFYITPIKKKNETKRSYYLYIL
jgi:hypothetical protein